MDLASFVSGAGAGAAVVAVAFVWHYSRLLGETIDAREDAERAAVEYKVKLEMLNHPPIAEPGRPTGPTQGHHIGAPNEKTEAGRHLTRHRRH